MSLACPRLTGFAFSPQMLSLLPSVSRVVVLLVAVVISTPLTLSGEWGEEEGEWGDPVRKQQGAGVGRVQL